MRNDEASRGVFFLDQTKFVESTSFSQLFKLDEPQKTSKSTVSGVSFTENFLNITDSTETPEPYLVALADYPLLGDVPREAQCKIDESEALFNFMEADRFAGVMLDVGAFRGTTSIPFAQNGWEVFAFEPDRENRKKLKTAISNMKLHSTITVDDRAVSNISGQKLPFYQSEESIAISSLSAFRDTHAANYSVETVTLRDFLSNKNLPSVDFLKIDTEGHDLFALQGFPWERYTPAFIECEYENFKTVPLGYTTDDLAEFLVEKGYHVYISEWYPIVKYGIRHDWRRLAKYPCELADNEGWGNIIAFKRPIEENLWVEALISAMEIRQLDAIGPENAYFHNIERLKKANHSNKMVNKPNNQGTSRAMSKATPPISEAKQAIFKAPKPNKRDSMVIKMRRLLPRFPSYVHFAEWVQSKNLTLFRIGQFSMWVLGSQKRHPMISALGLLMLCALLITPIYIPQLVSYKYYFWTAAGMLVFSAISLMGTSFVNKLMRGIAEREQGYRQALRADMMREMQRRQDQFTVHVKEQERERTELGEGLASQSSRQDELASTVLELRAQGEKSSQSQDQLLARVDKQEQQLAELGDSLASQSQRQDELHVTIDDLSTQGEKSSQSQDQLLARVDKQEQQLAELGDSLASQSQRQDELHVTIDDLSTQGEKSSQSQDQLLARVDEQGQQLVQHHETLYRKYNRLVASAPVFNFGDFQSFNRRLTKTYVDIIQQEWSRKLNLRFTPKSLAYLAHRVCTLESASRGRLAAPIEDAVLRILVASAVKNENLRVLEIGTLFGIGLAAIYEHTRSRFSSVHLTAIDPLDGYYGKDVRDIVTDEIIDERTFRSNLTLAGIPEQDYTLIKSMSTEDSAIEAAAKPLLHDVLIIDGDHSYAGVNADFLNYLPVVKRGGYIIFDDYDAPDWPDVKKFVDTVVRDNPGIAPVGASWRTAVFRVVGKSMAVKPQSKSVKRNTGKGKRGTTKQ